MAGNTHLNIDKANESLWQSRFSNSEKNSKKSVLVLKRSEKINYLKGIAYANLNCAAANFYMSRNDLALKHLSKALSRFEKDKTEKGYVRSLLLKGNIHESFGDYENTLKYWLEAWKIAVKINDKESEGESCSQLGLIYSRLGNFKKALDFFHEGLKIREDLQDENAVASSLNRIGMVLRQIKEYDNSLNYYFKSLEIRKNNNQTSAIPWTLLGIANTFEDIKKYPEALEYYEKGMAGGDIRCNLQCIMGSGRVYSLTGNAGKAEERLKESLRLARQIRSQVLITEAYAALAAHYERFKQAGKALVYFKLHLRAKDVYHSTEIRNRLSNIEVAHAIEKSENEKEIYRLKHVELRQAYNIIEEKNKDITDSINYACRIQSAILPDPHDIQGFSRKSFILYLPKDIVSGDFYWFTEKNKKLVVVAADCTGHGVPGALMSMLGISFLEELINKRGKTEPGKILDELRKEVQRAFHRKGNREEAKDGMDISICVIDRPGMTIQFAGAYNNLLLVRGGELTEYKADRMPVGFFDRPLKGFTSTSIPILKGDIIYMFSDGYSDQFGGPLNKKFKISSLKDLLVSISGMPLNEQKKRLENRFYRWKGDNPQTDDVLIVGIRL